MQEWVDSGISGVVLLALFILLVALAVGLLCIQKSSKAKEEEFRRLQGLASEDQARAEAEWEDEYKKLKHSNFSRAKLRRRAAAGESEAKAEERRQAEVEGNRRVQEELEGNLGKQVGVENFNRKQQGELGALSREHVELESANRKRVEEEAHSRNHSELEIEKEVVKPAEEETELRKRAHEEPTLQQQADLEVTPRNQADEQATHTRIVEEDQQVEVLLDTEPQKKQMVEGTYFCAACGKSTRRRCKQCKRVHYCSSECQMQHWVAVHKFECHQLKPGSPGSLDANGGTVTSEVVLSPGSLDANGGMVTSEVVLSPGSSGSENHKGFANSIDTSSANGVGPPVPMSYLGHTIPSRLPSSIVLSDGQQSKPKRILFSYDYFTDLFNWDMLNCPPCGLFNCGNSCFANVVLQCLYHTRPLTAYLLKEHHGESCSRREWCFMCELQKHVQRVKGSQVPVSPLNILSRIRKIGSQPGYGRQEDAHEIMRLSIDLMQMICLDHVGGERAVDVSVQQTSLIHHIFGGYLQSKVKCMQCLHESNRYEPMMDLAVEIQGDIKSLEGALTQFTGTELLDGVNKYKCECCNSYVKAHKQLTVYKAPNILTVALKRFQGGKFGKLNKRVAFPEALNMMPYMSQMGDQPPLYHLYAVVVHLDVLNASDFGHYICYVKNSLGYWYKVDDAKVDEVELHEVTSQRAYMLFYTRSSARPASVTEDGIVGAVLAAQQCPESGMGTVRFEHIRNSLYSLWASPEPSLDLIRSFPDADANGNGWYRPGNETQQNWSCGSDLDAQKFVSLSSGDAELGTLMTENEIMLGHSQLGHDLSTSQFAGVGGSRLNSNNLISIAHDSLVAFQSVSGNLEHSLSFQLSGPPWDVMMDENQQHQSSIKGLGKLVKRRLFKGLSSGLFSKPLVKDHLSALSAGSNSRPQLTALSSSSPSKSVLPEICVDSSRIKCSMWVEKPIQMYSPEDVWEKLFPVQAQQQHSSVSGALGPEHFQLFEANFSRQLEINHVQKVRGRNLQNCSGMLCGGCVWVLHPGKVDVCRSKPGFSHNCTTGDQNKLNELGGNVEGMICGDFSLSSMIITESQDMQGVFCPIEVI